MAPSESLPTASRSLSSLCAHFVQSVKWGTRTLTDHDIPEIAKSNLIMSFLPSSVSLLPSWSLYLQTVLLLRMTGTYSLADGKTDKLACRQTSCRTMSQHFWPWTLFPGSSALCPTMSALSAKPYSPWATTKSGGQRECPPVRIEMLGGCLFCYSAGLVRQHL